MSIPEANAELIERIVDIEQEMFRTVNSSVHSPCQENLKTFRVMRRMHHSVLPAQVLHSYFDDLHRAQQAGRNFMTEKYARMENRIPPLKQSRFIDDIVNMEMNWMLEVAEKYPGTFSGSGEMFRVYISCELETLSERTLQLLHNAVRKASLEKRNMVEERYNNLFRGFGYKSLADREHKKAASA